MSLLRRIELMEPYCLSPLFLAPDTLPYERFYRERFISSLDLLGLEPTPFELFDAVTDLIQLERAPSLSSYRRIRYRVGAESSYLLNLCDRVSELESKFDRLVSARRIAAGDRKHIWTAEIKGKDADRKYKLTAEIKGAKEEKEKEKEKHHRHHHRHHHHHHHHHKEGKSYKWIAEIKDKGEEGPITRTYTWKASNRDMDESSESGSEKEEKKHKKEKKHEEEKKDEKCTTRLVEIEEPSDLGVFTLRQAFAKRAGALRAAKGKKKELSPQDAALLIQMSFKAYLVRRSRALRALRELAVAKAKLKEIRALFNNFSYRRRVGRDAEERQRFSERIIVLLLTVDAIEGADLMVRASKKSMVDELEAMLDAVDPQPPGRSLSMKRRTFDVPDGVIQKEIAEGVTQIVRMLEEEDDQSSSGS
ncbi:BAG family molecular chaperone regulator 7 [Punica granatum]|uniref:BAG family molecular chaperone regulator 7 n=1 Tax=Punica granatum TaxID=22663 RepID=A0A6P8CFC0_PUNGR|nr:BAG family molecular chaperone regulator 7 [Punica granatum]